MKSRFALAALAAVSFILSAPATQAQEPTPAPQRSIFGRIFRQQTPDVQATPAPEQAQAPSTEANSSGNSSKKKDSGTATKSTEKKSTVKKDSPADSKADTKADSKKDSKGEKTEKASGAEDSKDTAAATQHKPIKTPKPAESDSKEKAPADDKKAAEATPATKDSAAAGDAKKASEAKRLDELVAQANNSAIEFLHLANKGQYNQAMLRLIPAQQSYFTGAESAACGVSFKALLDNMTRDGSMQRWNVASSMRGEGCRMTADIVYKDGRTSRMTFELQLVNNTWRIILPDVEKPLPAPTPVVAASPAAPAENPAPTAAPAQPAQENPASATPAAAEENTSAAQAPAASPADVIASLTNDNATTGGTVAPAAATPWRR